MSEATAQIDAALRADVRLLGDLLGSVIAEDRGSETVANVAMLANTKMDALFAATVQATEEAILNAMLAAETMSGADGARVEALPHDRLLDALRKYSRLR